MGRSARRRVVALCTAAVVLAPGASSTASAGSVERWDPRVEPIAELVEEIRQLEFFQPVKVELLAPAAFERRAREENVGGLPGQLPELVGDTGNRLKALGVVPHSTNITDADRERLGSGVLGYFDGGSIIVKGAKLTPFVEVVLAHELMHALQNQHFSAPSVDDSVGAQAALALQEGEAEWVSREYYLTMPFERRRAYDHMDAQVSAGFTIDLEDSDVPPFLVAAGGAPYLYGRRFADGVVATHGVIGLNDLWQDPPAHDAGVVNLLRDPHTSVHPVSAPRDDGEVRGGFRVGAVSLYQILATRIDPYEALLAADQWNGDVGVATTSNDSDSCIRMKFRTRKADDTGRLRAGLEAWADAKGNAEVSGDDPIEVTACENERAKPVTYDRVYLIGAVAWFRQALVVSALRAEADADAISCVTDTYFADPRLMPALKTLGPVGTGRPAAFKRLVADLREDAIDRCGFDPRGINEP